jgi:hypothetical protein
VTFATDSGRITGNPEVISSPVRLVPANALALSHLANFRVTLQTGNSHKSGDVGERLPSDLVFTN